MSIAFYPEDLSNEIIVKIFRNGLLAAAVSGSFALTDPSASKRVGTNSKFVVTSFPTRKVIYPVIVVRETSAPGFRPDSHHSKLMEWPYQVGITIRAETSTQLFPLTNAVRQWIQKKWDDIKNQGFYDMEVQASGDITWDTTSLVKEFTMYVNGIVFTTGEDKP